MAFYEMLPGAGMPSGLQAGMDSVLNKKFGTSTTYPAEGWPDNVNLMGPLPEKTVSGAIVTFSDGADAVPLKKCEITLPASLDGYSSVNVKHCGKNLFDKESATVITGYIGSSYYIEANPQTRTAYIPIFPNQTYTISKMVSSRFTVAVAPTIPSNNEPFTTRQSDHSASHLTITAGASDKYLWIFFYNGDSDTATIAEILNTIQVEIGASATSFEPYSGTTHTASLGRTIYGGTADVVAGQGTESHGNYTLPSTGWTYYATGGKNTFNITIPNCKNAPALCSLYTYKAAAYIAAQDDKTFMFFASGSDIKISVCDNDYTSASDFGAHIGGASLVHELATPNDFTFDPVPIDSKLGANTLWSEQGDTEVTYRADIALALGE